MQREAQKYSEHHPIGQARFWGKLLIYINMIQKTKSEGLYLELCLLHPFSEWPVPTHPSGLSGLFFPWRVFLPFSLSCPRLHSVTCPPALMTLWNWSQYALSLPILLICLSIPWKMRPPCLSCSLLSSSLRQAQIHLRLRKGKDGRRSWSSTLDIISLKKLSIFQVSTS